MDNHWFTRLYLHALIRPVHQTAVMHAAGHYDVHPKRQSARMSKITNDSLTLSDKDAL